MMTSKFNINKFEALYEKIPKFPEIWSTDDVLVWLKLIGMEKYSENFVEMGIDGLLILDLEESDIEEELQIKTKLHRKKIMKGLTRLKEYTKYLKDLSEEQKIPHNSINENDISSEKSERDDKHRAPMVANPNNKIPIDYQTGDDLSEKEEF